MWIIQPFEKSDFCKIQNVLEAVLGQCSCMGNKVKTGGWLVISSSNCKVRITVVRVCLAQLSLLILYLLNQLNFT